MEQTYFYIDPRGRRSGPLTETELERLAELGGIEWSGSVELEGLGRVWKVAEVGWIAEAMGRARGSKTGPVEVADPSPQPDPASSGPSWPAPKPAPTSTSMPGVAPALSPPDAPPPATPSLPPTAVPSPVPVPSSACPRSTYVLLGLLPGLVGLFGIHNLVAGYVARGVTQLVLSLLTVGGLLGFVSFGGCCCVAIPTWIVLGLWTIVEVATVTRDARGVLMA